jgi:hypothetical protein
MDGPSEGHHAEEVAVCPACLTTLALAAGTAGASGGLAAVLLRCRNRMRRDRRPPQVSPPKEKSP